MLGVGVAFKNCSTNLVVLISLTGAEWKAAFIITTHTCIWHHCLHKLSHQKKQLCSIFFLIPCPFFVQQNLDFHVYWLCSIHLFTSFIPFIPPQFLSFSYPVQLIMTCSFILCPLPSSSSITNNTDLSSSFLLISSCRCCCFDLDKNQYSS